MAHVALDNGNFLIKLALNNSLVGFLGSVLSIVCFEVL